MSHHLKQSKSACVGQSSRSNIERAVILAVAFGSHFAWRVIAVNEISRRLPADALRSECNTRAGMDGMAIVDGWSAM